MTERNTNSTKADAIIVAFKSEEVIGSCVDSLAADPAVGSIMVVNNSPGDAVSTMIGSHPDATLIDSPGNPGFGAGVNMGAQYVNSDFVVIANPDVIQERDTVSKCIAFLKEKPRAAVVGPLLQYQDGSFYGTSKRDASLLRFLAARVPWLSKFGEVRTERAHGVAHKTDWLTGAFLVARKEALDQVGWFDSSIFLFGEDADLCLRLRVKGWEVWFSPLGLVRHKSGHAWRQADSTAMNRLMLQARYRRLISQGNHFSGWLYRRMSGLNEISVSVGESSRGSQSERKSSNEALSKRLLFRQ